MELLIFAGITSLLLYGLVDPIKEKYQNCNKVLKINEKRWNDPDIVKYNNCYAYAFRDYSKNRKKKPQPGYKSEFKQITKDKYNCEEFIKRILADYPNAKYLGNYNTTCENCGRSIFLALSPDKFDYHFWRQNSDGKWSHKPGSLPVSTLDASKKEITNPLESNRKFPRFNYSLPCGYFCQYD